jgi:mannose-6-phosphate isomerase-like protein (cupin superfamily)
MTIVESDVARSALLLEKDQGRPPNYDIANPVQGLIAMTEEFPFAADRQHYLVDSLQYLFPISSLAFYGPAAGTTVDPREQDDKNDFQKQNLREFALTGLEVARGFAAIGDAWIGSFLSIAYSPSASSPLVGSNGMPIHPHLQLYLKVGAAQTDQLVTMPYDDDTGRYRVEFWALNDLALVGALGPKADAAWGKFLHARPDLVTGTHGDLYASGIDDARKQAVGQGSPLEMLDYQVTHTMHPIRPLLLELAFTDPSGAVWDSMDGRNHRLEFSMSMRGWNSFLAVGKSRNAHGGMGGLEYRNLYSNYFGHEAKRRGIFRPDILNELGRDLPEWSFDADWNKPPSHGREPFMAVDYMDLHLLEPNAIIGVHRHRDNQEVFLLMDGKVLMVMADWEQGPDRARAFEIRTMKPGDLSLVKGGQMHALINNLDEKALLFMFGGYD